MKKLANLFFFGFRGLLTGLYYVSGLWLIRNLSISFYRRMRELLGKPEKPAGVMSRRKVLEAYGLDEDDARDWAASLRMQQYALLAFMVLILLLGTVLGPDFPSRSIAVPMILATVLIIFTLAVPVLRNEWRIELLTGQRCELLPFRYWLLQALKLRDYDAALEEARKAEADGKVVSLFGREG